MFIILALLRIGVHCFVRLFPHHYIAELIISFVPYSIVGHRVMTVFFALVVGRDIYNKKKIWKVGLMRVFISLIGFFFAVSTTIQYANMYQDTKNTIGYGTGQKLSFLYANIYYKNKNFSWLLSTIETHNPDIILLVEYAKKHDDALSTILKKEYPYRSRYVGGKHFDGDIIYSRYPLRKIDHEMPLWSRSFSHVQVQKLPNSQLLDIALVHTSAPISPLFWEMRDDQLDKLQDVLSQYYTGKNNLSDKDVVVLGDFNVSPRSPSYLSFSQNIKVLWLHNFSLDLAKTNYHNLFPYTWCRPELPFVCSHIDHVWSDSASMRLQKIDIVGSDHDGFIWYL